MTITGPTAAPSGIPVDPLRRTAFLAGALYLITVIASIPAIFVLDPVLSFFWELSLGVWLAVKGFTPSPITAGSSGSVEPPAAVSRA